MEVVGLVSSLAGIAAFTGQALDGIIKLRTFWKDVARAETTSLELLNELENLMTTVTGIRQLVTTVYNVSDDRTGPEAMIGLSSLTTNLTYCVEDVTAWVQVIKSADPSSATGIRAFLRKMKVAADKSGIQEIGRKISTHQKRLGLGLSILGRALDHAGIDRLDKLSTKIDGLSESQLKLNDSIENNLAAFAATRPHKKIRGGELQHLETSIDDGFDRMSLNHSESQRSIRSLSNSISSLASQMSQLMNLLPLPPSIPGYKEAIVHQVVMRPNPEIAESDAEWCCDALSGIDDGFAETGRDRYTCIYCPFSNLQSDSDSSRERGRHLVEAHSFGKCNLMVSYLSWDELAVHLESFHTMQEGRNSSSNSHFCRRKRSRSLFRDTENSHDHPSNAIERSTQRLIMLDGIRMALDETYSDGVSKYPQYYQIVLLRNDFRLEKPFLNLRCKIACLFEELILSDNDHYVESPFHWWCIRTHGIKPASLTGSFKKRSNINIWLFHVLKNSLPLWVLLSCGKVTPEVQPATFINWLLPILGVWNIDKAATGAEQMHQPSEGAVDSRDDLKTRGTCSDELEPRKQELHEDIRLHQAIDPPVPRVPDIFPPKKDEGEVFVDHLESS